MIPRDPLLRLRALGCSSRFDCRGWTVLERYAPLRAGKAGTIAVYPSLVGEGLSLESALDDAVRRGNACAECGGPTWPEGAVVCADKGYCHECAERHVEVCR